MTAYVLPLETLEKRYFCIHLLDILEWNLIFLAKPLLNCLFRSFFSSIQTKDCCIQLSLRAVCNADGPYGTMAR